jgi:outer membrane lipoprotein-sorting protein
MLRLLKTTLPFCAFAVILSCLPASAPAQANQETLRALGEVQALGDKVRSFRANLEVRDKQAAQEQVTTSSLSVSKEQGWHIRSSADGASYEFICDFQKFYQFYPAEMKAYMHSPGPEMQPMLRKPVTDLNPLTLLDVNTIKFKGKGEINGESVYHFEGTTSTQFLPQGKPVERKMEAWISTKDGLPRKTVESVGPAVGTTIYSNVELNPTFSADEFKFTPPVGVQVIDATAQMKAMEEQQNNQQQGRGARPAIGAGPAGAGAAPTTGTAATPRSSDEEKPKD